MKSRLARLLKSRIGIIVVVVVLLAGALTYVSIAPLAHTFAGQNPIQVENSLPGTPGWNDFSANSQPDALSGFGSKISVNHGDSLDLYVTTTAPSFTIDIYRTGYYGGAGARLVTSLGSFTGLHQAIPNPDPVTGLISCLGWTKTTTLTIPQNWVTGVYLAKLTSSTGNSSFIFFVVRNDGGSEDIVFQTSVTTYQAYNTWGGLSLYNNNLTTNKNIYPYPHATKVSFDRPFNPGDSNGAGHYFFYEYKYVYWLESQGYNVTYTTNVDTDTNASTLTNHKAFLSVGHDEYWSAGMRNTVQNAINHGVNVGFFSANTMYWQIRFEPNTNGVPDRIQVGYKDFADANVAPGPDPQWNVNNSIVTANWRDPVVNQPENGLLGVMYEQQEDNDYAYVVQNASNWIYANTGFVDGTSIPGIVGYEYDRVWNNGFTPPGMTVLSNSPVNGCCGGFHSFANSTLYTAPSGARVFAAGTIQWSLGLANIQGNTYENAGIQQTTTNILNSFIGASSASTPALSLSPDSLSFGNQAVGLASSVQTVTVKNVSSSAVSISNIAATGTNASDFSQTNTCGGSLAANATCTVNITFKPGAAGARGGAITLTDGGTGSPQDIVLNGTAISTGPAVNPSSTYLAFGNQNVGTTSPSQSITITNSGASALTFSSISVNGSNANDFGETDNCSSGSIAVGASCTINVTFTPGAAGARSGGLYVVDNAANSPQTFTLTGTGVSTTSNIVLNPSNLNFGNQNVGSTSSGQATLSNNSASALSITSIAVTGANASDFAQTNNCGSSLASGANCTINVTFTPGGNGARTGSVNITDNATGSPQTLTLNGVGVTPAPGVNLSPNNLTFASQYTAHTSPPQAISMVNNGTVALTIASIAVTGTNVSDFAQTNNCGTNLAAGASCTINVTFTPTAAGSRSANILVSDNANGQDDANQIVSLTGTGIAAPTVFTLSDGFEDGNFSQWTNPGGGNGSATVESSVVNTGTHAAQLTNTSGQTIQISTTFTTGSLVYTRFYFRLSGLSGTTLIALGQDSGGHNQWIVYYDSARQGLDIYFWNGAGARFDLYSNTNIVNTNAWYSLELGVNQATSGQGQVWLNGNSVGTVSGDLTESQPYGKLILDNEVAGTVYFDDVKVTNGYNGPLASTAATVSPTALSFGSEIVGTTSPAEQVLVTNSGTNALSISGISFTGTNAGDYAQTNNCPASLAVNATCTVNVTFAPSASGTSSASLNVNDGAGDSPQVVALSGSGVTTAPAVSLSTSSLSFGNQNVGTTSTAQPVTLTNTGTAALSISSIGFTGTNPGSFSQTNNCGSSLAAGANCTINVSFSPSAAGASSANLTLTDNVAGSPQTVSLSGTGVSVSTTVYYSDGFESGDFSHWTNGTGGTGTATVENSVAHTGTYAAQLTNASGQYTQVITTFTSATLTYTSFAFRFSSLGTTVIALGQDTGGHNQWVMYYDAARQGLDIYFWNGAGTRYDLYSNTNLVSANTWYTIELEMNQTSSGSGQVWLNGTSVGSFSGDFTETLSYGKFILDNEATGTDYFDDVRVANTY